MPALFQQRQRSVDDRSAVGVALFARREQGGRENCNFSVRPLPVSSEIMLSYSHAIAFLLLTPTLFNPICSGTFRRTDRGYSQGDVEQGGRGHE
jgi:hypothetical protein